MKIVRPTTVDDSVLTSSSIAETDYPEYNPATSYGLNERVIIGSLHKIFRSVIAANTGHNPADEIGSAAPTYWVDEGATNKWRMFDKSVTSQSTAEDEIVVSLAVPGHADSVILMNISCATVHVVMTDATFGVVYDKTYTTASNNGINNWYDYFFEPIERFSDLAITDLPNYTNVNIDVTLTDTGSTVKCGACIVGYSKNIGEVQFGAKVGIQDYSVKQRDSFGNYTILERAFSKYANLNVWVEAGFVDRLYNLLAGYRSVPCVYIGTDEYASTLIYGFFKDFYETIAYPTYSICTLELEGLT